MIPIKKILFSALLVGVPLALGVGLAVYVERGHATLEGVSATVLSEAKALPVFALEDYHSRAFDNSRLEGGWSFLFFGFTHCPHICPTTLATLSRVSETLAETPGAPSPRTVFISVDPERDTHARIADYLLRFNRGFIGATGALQDLRAFATSLGIAFGKEDAGAREDYDVFHSGRILLIDPQGRLKALFSSPHEDAAIVADYLKIVAASS